MSTKLQNPGRYQATVTSAEFGESQEKKTPYLHLALETEAGESISAWLYLSEKALPSSLKTLREAFGFNGDFEHAIEQVVGKACSIVVETEVDSQGAERLRVRWINPVSKAQPIADQASFLRSLTAKAARIPARAPVAAAPTRAVSPRPPAAAPAPAAAAVATATNSETVPF